MNRTGVPIDNCIDWSLDEFDDYDAEFVENEEAWTAGVAHYVDEHIEEFVVVEE